MNTWLMSTRRRVARWAAVGIGSLLAAAGLASTASAEHSLLEQVSTGPTGGNGAVQASFAGASTDGTRVFYTTAESLVSADTDTAVDVYERSGGQTTLVSAGPTGGNGAFDAAFDGASADGSLVFFRTWEPLVSADTDLEFDVYERSGGQTTLVSIGTTGGNGAYFAGFAGASADGSRVFFWTDEPLVSADTDTNDDVYERSGGQTTLVSTGPVGGNGAADAQFAGASVDGTRVFFQTNERLVGADTDDSRDVYERAGGQTMQVSTGPAGGNGAVTAFLAGVSADGTRVFFSTYESLVSADTDGRLDVYERAGGQTTLVSPGPAGGNADFDAIFRGVSSDGSRVFLQTLARLVSTDADDSQDVYERAGGQTTLVSAGPAGGNGAVHAGLTGLSADGMRVFFTTWEPLVSGDTDAAFDVYERAGGQTTLLSTGPTGGNGAFDARFVGASADGTRVFFATVEPLVSTDTDTSEDVYVKRIVAPVNTARPTISGTPLVGRRLTCSPGTWDHNPTRLAYQWKRAGVAINGATSSSYSLVAADGARSITCTVTASNSAGSRSATSASVIPRFAGACANVQTGGPGPNRLTGLALGDRLVGFGGNDVLIGLAGDDCLSGGIGSDTLAAGAGNDTLAGDAGNDILRGDSGTDRFAGGAGNDTINSRDGRRETVDCGLGSRDRVTADRVDRVVGCEIVRRG
jgi:hypothetical protein